MTSCPCLYINPETCVGRRIITKCASRIFVLAEIDYIESVSRLMYSRDDYGYITRMIMKVQRYEKA